MPQPSGLNWMKGQTQAQFKSDADYSGWSSQAAQGAGEVGAAAGMSTLGDVNAEMRSNAPKWGGISQASQRARSQMKQASMQANSEVAATGVQAYGQTQAAAHKAAGEIKGAQAAAQGAMMGSAMSAIGAIGGALMMSDERTKNNIERLDNALDMLRRLTPVSFQYNEEYSSSPERVHYGFIAQDYIKVMPDATYYDESSERLCIDTVELVGVLVRAVQELDTKVTRLSAERHLQVA